ncbi:MAG: hypothetical protein ACPHLK_04185, partial [Gammaproteobacteria bacterium]
QVNSNTDAIYWVITALPMVLMNITPYIDFSLPETIDSDETYRQLVIIFSVSFVFLVVSTFSSIKCFLNSEALVGKIFASLFFLLYLLFIIGMIYFYFSGYLTASN